VGAAGIAACLTLLSSCSAPQVAGIQDRGPQTVRDIANPILEQFMAICSLALNDAKASDQLALDVGWEEFGPADATGRGFRLSPGANVGEWDLTILNGPQSNSPGAAYCGVSGWYVHPVMMRGLDTFNIPGYVATDDGDPFSINRRLEGTASFGDPVLIELIASSAQGAATIRLNLINLARPLPSQLN